MLFCNLLQKLLHLDISLIWKQDFNRNMTSHLFKKEKYDWMFASEQFSTCKDVINFFIVMQNCWLFLVRASSPFGFQSSASITLYNIIKIIILKFHCSYWDFLSCVNNNYFKGISLKQLLTISITTTKKEDRQYILSNMQ